LRLEEEQATAKARTSNGNGNGQCRFFAALRMERKRGMVRKKRNGKKRGAKGEIGYLALKEATWL
jgi:hypothetical protein